jgi:hypothetical protein
MFQPGLAESRGFDLPEAAPAFEKVRPGQAKAASDGLALAGFGLSRGFWLWVENESEGVRE